MAHYTTTTFTKTEEEAIDRIAESLVLLVKSTIVLAFLKALVETIEERQS